MRSLSIVPPDQEGPVTPVLVVVSLSDTLYDDMEIHKQNPACVWVPENEEVVTNTSAL